MAPREVENFSVKEILTELVLPRLDSIEKAANARTDAVEMRVSHLEGWRDRFGGALAIVSALLLPVAVPIIIATFSGLMK